MVGTDTPQIPRPVSFRLERKAANASLVDWIAVSAGALGAMMATLDIAIVNTALPTIVGELGIKTSEGSWLATTYLVAEVIAIPLCGWLERAFGLRTFLMLAISLFTAFSILCGVATDLPTMILGRAGQGFFGGMLIPTALTLIALRLPEHQRPLGMAIFGATAILGPVAGPLLGGYITDSFSWRYAFLINLPVGFLLLALLALGLEKTRGSWHACLTADWLGILGMSVFLGCLTTLLEQGAAEEWFDSLLIRELAIASAAGLALLIIGQLRSQFPVIDLRLLRNRQFAAVFLMSFMMGAALYGTAIIIPQFLSLVSGDNALQAGFVVVIAGIPAIVLLPLIPAMLRRVDLRVGIAIGLIAMALTCGLDAMLTSASGDGAFTLSQLLRGAGQVIALTFLNQAAMGTVAPTLAADASGLFNVARNLGGSVGLALLATLHEWKFDQHSGDLAASVEPGGNLPEWLAQAVSQLDPAGAIALLQREASREALALSFNDQFFALAVGLVCILPLVMLIRQPRGQLAAGPFH